MQSAGPRCPGVPDRLPSCIRFVCATDVPALRPWGLPSSRCRRLCQVREYFSTLWAVTAGLQGLKVQFHRDWRGCACAAGARIARRLVLGTTRGGAGRSDCLLRRRQRPARMHARHRWGRIALGHAILLGKSAPGRRPLKGCSERESLPAPQGQA